MEDIYWSNVIYFIGLKKALQICKIPPNIKNNLIKSEYLNYCQKMKLTTNLNVKGKLTKEFTYLFRLNRLLELETKKQVVFALTSLNSKEADDCFLIIFGISIKTFFDYIRKEYSKIYSNAIFLTKANITNEIDTFADDFIIEKYLKLY